MKTYHWHVLVTYQWDVSGCFIWDLFETSWRCTDGTSSLGPHEASSRHTNKTSWKRTTETSWRRSTETSLGVSFETYLRRHWDVQRDVITTSPQRRYNVLLPGGFSIKMPGGATPIFHRFFFTSMNSKSDVEINGWSYVLIFTVFTRNQVDDITAVTRQFASDIIKPTSNFTLIRIISYQRIFADVLFLTKCYTAIPILRFDRKRERW